MIRKSLFSNFVLFLSVILTILSLLIFPYVLLNTGSIESVIVITSIVICVVQVMCKSMYETVIYYIVEQK